MAASFFTKLCCAVKPNRWNSTTMITMITILFLKSYNQFSIWRTKGEKRMPQHDMIAGFQCIPGEGSVPFFLMLQKFSAKTGFGKKRGRVRSCTTVCNAFSASSARARVQKCTKMQAGRSFDVASAKFSTFAHKLLKMSFDHIGLNNSCCWKR